MKKSPRSFLNMGPILFLVVLSAIGGAALLAYCISTAGDLDRARCSKAVLDYNSVTLCLSDKGAHCFVTPDDLRTAALAKIKLDVCNGRKSP